MTRIVLKNGEIIDTKTPLKEICEYITNSTTGAIYLFNIENTADVIEINNIKSIESI